MTQPATAPEKIPYPMLFLLMLKDGTLWQVGGSVPGSDETGTVDAQGNVHPELAGTQALKIVKMVERDDDSVVVYAVPVKGSTFDQNGQGLIFKHPAESVRQLIHTARFDSFQLRMDKEISEWEADDREEEEEDEDEEGLELPKIANGTTVGVTS
jgi:hypothetical protein